MNKVKLVFAVCPSDPMHNEDYHFGNKGELPWGKVKEELNHFKEETKNTILVMGAKTFLSLPGKLPERIHVVLTNQAELIRTKDGKPADMVFKGGTLSNALDALKASYPDTTISVIGGKSLIDECLKYNLADEIVISFMVPKEGLELESDVKIKNEDLYFDADVYSCEDGSGTVFACTDTIEGFYVERWEKV